MKQQEFKYEFSKKNNRNSDGPRILDKQSIQFSYENTLDVTARLFAFASAGRMLNAGIVNERQEKLAINDLIVFALHARRLITDVGLVDYTKNVHVPLKSDSKKSENIWRILGILIQNDFIKITSTFFEFQMMAAADATGKLDMGKIPYSAWAVNPQEHPIPHLLTIRSDKASMMGFQLVSFMALFAERVLVTVVDVCEKKNIYLDESIFE